MIKGKSVCGVVNKGPIFLSFFSLLLVLLNVVLLSLSRRGGTLESGEKNNSLTNKKERERETNESLEF